MVTLYPHKYHELNISRGAITRTVLVPVPAHDSNLSANLHLVNEKGPDPGRGRVVVLTLTHLPLPAACDEVCRVNTGRTSAARTRSAV